MNRHQPYRDWIFAEEPLEEDSRRRLNMHMDQCAECRATAEGWRLAKQSLENAELAAPREGFAARWKALARSRQRAPKRRQAWALLAANSLGAVAAAAALAFQTSARGLSLAGVFTRDMTAAASILNDWTDASQAVGGVFRIVSDSIPPAAYLFTVLFLSLAGILCLLIAVRIRSRGRK
ncbi:MAG: hypothetical protein ACK2UB_12130 [Anaerolineales bacterium]|jgi:anti-sigma factor RsiW